MAMGVSKKDMVMVAVLLAGTLLAVLNQTLLSPALPAIMSSLGVDATTVQWLIRWSRRSSYRFRRTLSGGSARGSCS